MEHSSKEEWLNFYEDSGSPHKTSDETILQWFLPKEGKEENNIARKPRDLTERKHSILGYNADLVFPAEKKEVKKIGEITGGEGGALYIGAYSAACDETFLALHEIRAVLNCAYECKNVFPNVLSYKKLELDDTEDGPLLAYLPDAIKFLDEHLGKGENVFVHCQMGKSRSAAVVIAYLIHHLHLSLDEAYSYLKEKRSLVEPNPGFLKQLGTYGSHNPPS